MTCPIFDARDAIENNITLVKEIAAEVLAAGPNYKTATEEYAATESEA